MLVLVLVVYLLVWSHQVKLLSYFSYVCSRSTQRQTSSWIVSLRGLWCPRRWFQSDQLIPVWPVDSSLTSSWSVHWRSITTFDPKHLDFFCPSFHQKVNVMKSIFFSKIGDFVCCKIISYYLFLTYLLTYFLLLISNWNTETYIS